MIARFWWIAPLLASGLAAGGWHLMRDRSQRSQPLEGYIGDVETLKEEFSRINGALLEDEELKSDFTQAAQSATSRDFSNAAALLERAVQKAPLPVILNDLGVLYIKLGDRSRAINAFRDALSRDIGYEPVRANLARFKDVITVNMAEPVSVEIEPNNTTTTANLIALSKPVKADIPDGQNDSDFFRFEVPAPPRDMMELEITNGSKTLAPAVSFYDYGFNLQSWGNAQAGPGASVSQRFSAGPGATFYVQVRGLSNTGGTYTLTMRRLGVYDGFEPNDNIANASRITLGEGVNANIMDSEDADCYAFMSPRDGKVRVTITNRSESLIPALATFTPDRRSSGFGPDLKTKGASLTHEMAVQKAQTYYLQIWGVNGTPGEYTLRVD